MTKDLDDYVRQVCVEAKLASKRISTADHKAKDHALLAIAAKIRKSKNEILAANEKDLKAGANLEDALLDRLTLNPNRIESMASGVEEVAGMPDPVGEISNLSFRPSGIQVGRMRVPIGGVAVIYESRPNVTADVSAVCIKSGNAVILKGGSEAIHSNTSILKVYLNGEDVGGTTVGASSTPNDNSYPLTIGSRWFSSSYGLFKGQIDDVRIWDSALTQEQIQEDMN